jgi:hypothetical protein
MSAKDKFHEAVKNALIKDGWSITHDPFRLDFGFTDTYIDLGAEKFITADKDDEKIAIEIKSFISKSELYEFYTALGQFLGYRMALKRVEPERVLFLAVPKETYNNLFHQTIISDLVLENNVKIIVYNSVKEVIVEWKK